MPQRSAPLRENTFRIVMLLVIPIVAGIGAVIAINAITGGVLSRFL